MEISFQCGNSLTKNFILCNTKCVPAKSGSRFALGKTMSAARAPRSAFFVSAFYGGLCSEGLARSARATLGMAHHQSYFALDGGGSSTSYEYTEMQNLSIFARQIRQQDGLYCLNDLHQNSGYETQSSPFFASAKTRTLINHGVTNRSLVVNDMSTRRVSACTGVWQHA